MNDFFDELKALKKDMVKDQEKSIKDGIKAKEEESIKAREKRLQDEFLEYVKDTNIKKI